MSYSYHRIIRKVVIAFGNLFNNINISRYDQNGIEKEHFLVPIIYGGKEKYVSRLEGDPGLDKKVQITLPIMSFEMTNMSYDATRKLNTNTRLAAPSADGAHANAVYNPVPFDFDFSLYAYVRNIEDGAQLMEKILPFFTPDYTVSVNMIPEMGIIKQLPIVLKNVTNEIDYEGDYNTKIRSVIWTLNFTIKGYLYGPISQPSVIRTAITNILNDTNGTQDLQISLANGFGDYKIGENIYQGYNKQTATATAKVCNWNPSSNTLLITNATGHFISGQKIIGDLSNATWTSTQIGIQPGNLVNIVVTPNPEDVILPNNYTYTTVITEYPDI